MRLSADYLVVGAGLTGAVIARELADAGREVVVVDRRTHVGGNVHDHTHPSGIRIHTYGPHYFRTSSDQVWDFATRFGKFDPYVARLRTTFGGQEVPWPLQQTDIERLWGSGWSPGRSGGSAANMEEAALRLMPVEAYEVFVRDYNLKQWGVPPAELDPSLCTRFDVRKDGETALKPDARHQGIPVNGYAAWTVAMFAGIPVVLGFDYATRKAETEARRMLIFTGPIDEFFGFSLGRLRYRGQQRSHTYLPDVDGFAQSVGQVNNPTIAGGPHIRTLEWKQMMPAAVAARIRGTVLTTETPYQPTDPDAYEYPFPDKAFAALHKSYAAMASADAKLLVAGRLGEGRYLDMDQAIARAQVLAGRLLAL